MGTIFELISNIWNICSLIYYFNNFFILTLTYFSFQNLPGKENHSEIYAHSLNIFLIKIRYSWILSKIFVNRNIICQITIFVNRNTIHEMQLWQIGTGIYLWPKYQQTDLWRIYSRTIRELFANWELFFEHCCDAVLRILNSLVIMLIHYTLC